MANGKSFSAMILLAFLLSFSGCAGTKENVITRATLEGRRYRVVVYPLENLSGNPAPVREVRQSFIDEMAGRGFDVIDEQTLRGFMAKNRIRYTGGLDWITAKALKDDLGVDGVLIISLELYLPETLPKIALTARMVASGEKATIAWIDGVGLAGDDSPGILNLGLIEDPQVLTKKAIQSLVASLTESLSGHKGGTTLEKSLPKKYRPRVVFRSPLLETGRKYTIAVVPFFNKSERKNADEIMVLQFIRQLKRFETFEIIEPGIIRQEFLTLRIIMEGGISLDQTDVVFAALGADLILSGKVLDYQDYRGTWGKPKVDFSALLIEPKSRSVVWNSTSVNDGQEGVYFFDVGKVNTAHELTDRMVRSIGEIVTKGLPEETIPEVPSPPAIVD